MRIRYAYKLEDAEGKTTFAVLNNKLSEEEVLEKFAPKGAVKAAFHERVRTGFRLSPEGDLVETGLVAKPADAPKEAPASPKAPKAKKAKKASKGK